MIRTAEGNGPVNALDQALRLAIASCYPALERVHLTDYKVRVLDTDKGTAAVTRVLIDSTNGDLSWSTIGVSENIIEASWTALFDSIVFGLLHTANRARLRRWPPPSTSRSSRPTAPVPTSRPTTCPVRGWPIARATSTGWQPEGLMLGDPGPDQGFALLLARRFEDRLQLADLEHAEDAVAGCVAVATRRASLFRRAPVIHDLDIAFTVWGFLDPAPPAELVALRRSLFPAVSHPIHYREQRVIAHHVPESTLRMSRTCGARRLSGALVGADRSRRFPPAVGAHHPEAEHDREVDPRVRAIPVDVVAEPHQREQLEHRRARSSRPSPARCAPSRPPAPRAPTRRRCR